MKSYRKYLSYSLFVMMSFAGFGIADDTDIYLGRDGLGGSTSEEFRPNVMFILDTSGSMSNKDGGSESRLQRMKNAFTRAISSSEFDNMNIGLMRFHNQGGPVLYPVRHTNSAAVVDPFFATNISRAVAASSDDAEEPTEGPDTGVVDIDDETIELVRGPGVAAPTPGARPSGASFIHNPGMNDAFEDASMNTNYNTTEINLGGGTIDPADPRIAGFRFSGVPIPQGSTILNAQVVFYATADPGDPAENTNILIQVEDSGNAGFLANNAYANISSRSWVASTVNWSGVPQAAQGEEILTPNLRSMVQEVVDRTDWTYGNHMVFAFKGEGNREVHTNNYAGGIYRAQLKVTYADPGVGIESIVIRTIPDDDAEETFGGDFDADRNALHFPYRGGDSSKDQRVGMRFSDIDIPRNATIYYTELEFTARTQTPGEDVNLRISVEDAVDSQDYATDPTVLGRPLFIDPLGSTPVVDWFDLATPWQTHKVQSPDLTDLIQPMVNRFDWDVASDISLLVEDNLVGTTGSNFRSYYSGNSADFRNHPLLRIWYVDDGSKQLTGLRFSEMTIPAGATITSAHLEFSADGFSGTSTDLEIHGENNGNAITFSNAAGELISDRPLTASSVNWDNIGNWEDSELVTSPDISSVIQEIVSGSDWCGGNSLALVISGDGKRKFKSFDHSASSSPPRLHVSYDSSGLGAGEGCFRRSVSYSVGSSTDDGEEYSSGNMSLTGSQLNLGNNGQTTAMRFTNVQVPAGATIIESNMVFTSYARSGNNATASYTIKGQNPGSVPDPAATFTYNDDDISDRPTVGSTVAWGFSSAETWNIDGERIVTPDISNIVQDIVDQSGWSGADPMVMIVEGTGHRTAYSYNSNPTRAPVLNISFEANLGDYPSGAQPGVTTVRDELLNTIDDLTASSYTPIVDTLWEAARYFRGEQMQYGRSRGAGDVYGPYEAPLDYTSHPNAGLDETDLVDSSSFPMNLARITRVSHPESYTGGTVSRRTGCTDADLNDWDCRDEYIQGAPTYISPITSACSTSYLVLLTDGAANRNHSAYTTDPDDVPTNLGACNETITTSAGGERNPSNGEKCGVKVADYLRNNDNSPTVDGDNYVKTYTIGFNLGSNQSTVDFLTEIAEQGGGDFFPAESEDQLVDVLSQIANTVQQEEGAFTAPSVSVNAFNRLFNRPVVYLSLFQSDKKHLWQANLKKYGICPSKSEPGCDFGEMIDKNGAPAMILDETDPEFGNIKETAVGYWSQNGSNGRAVTEGGAASQLEDWQTRDVYVYTSAADPTPDSNPRANVLGNGSAFTKIDKDAMGLTPDDPSVGGGVTTSEFYKAITLQHGLCADPASPGNYDAACVEDMALFVLGHKPIDADDSWANGIPNNTESPSNRWLFTDALHSQPVVVSYGGFKTGSDETLIGKIVWGTSDGALHMINEHTAKEEFAVYPAETLGNLDKVMDNAAKSDHVYGLDGTPTMRRFDSNLDGIIDPAANDFIHAFMGQRRGGRNILAFNLTPSRALNSAADLTAVDTVVPRLLWRISGIDTAPFPADEWKRYIGDTWSTPIPVRMRIDGVAKTVLVFGGGYDPDTEDRQDPAAPTPWGDPNTKGNAMFIVDASTGDLVWWAGPIGSGADLELANMTSSIAADLTPMDSDLDQFIDRIYAVDVSGQVWRVDINTADISESTAGRLAMIAEPASGMPLNHENERKFFHGVTVASVSDTQYSDGNQDYDMVSIVSGNRADPVGTEINDRAYLFRDYLIAPQTIELDGSNQPTNYPKCNNSDSEHQCHPSATSLEPLDEDDLVDVTDFVLTDRTDVGVVNAASTSEKDDLKKSEGWYVRLEYTGAGKGEKGFSSTTIADGVIYFTTYIPAEEEIVVGGGDQTCKVAIGESLLYAVNAYTGSPEFENWAGGDSSLETQDRVQFVGAGPSSQPFTMDLPDGSLVQRAGQTGVANAQQIDGTIPVKTYWFED